MPLDADAIADLYRRHARAMLTFFARRTHDPEVAVDLVAETFASAIADGGQFRGATDEEAVGWLFGIARHQLAGWYRRGEVERRAMGRLEIERRALEDSEYERIVELAGLEARRARVRRSLGGLSPAIGRAVRLRVLEERSYASVAKTLGITEQAARARVSRGLRLLASEIAGGEDLERSRSHG